MVQSALSFSFMAIYTVCNLIDIINSRCYNYICLKYSDFSVLLTKDDVNNQEMKQRGFKDGTEFGK